MNILVASSSAPDRTDEDFSWAVDGELVWFGYPCSTPGCGCTSSVAGLASARATSMFRVLDDPRMTKEEYLLAFKDGLVRQGWLQPGDEAAAREIDDWAEEHLEIAAAFPAGTALRIDDGRVSPRAVSP